MMHRFAREVRGSTSMEFALVAPLFVAFLFGGLVLGVAAWQRNVLQDVASESARCIAVGGTACATAAAGCVGTASACFAVQRANERGLRSLQVDQVSVDANASVNGTAFTTVSVTYPFSVAGKRLPLTATASFPNGG